MHKRVANRLTARYARLPLTLLVALSLVLGAVGLYIMQGSTVHAANPPANSETVLFIHGSSGNQSNGSGNSVPGGCDSTWGTDANPTGNNAIAYLRSHGWTGPLKTVGFYKYDWYNDPKAPAGTAYHHCDIQFDSHAVNAQNVSISQHQAICNSYKYVASDEGTNNEDLRNTACNLAWYIYLNYSLLGQNVRVVAHSMGGLIIRWALHAIDLQDPAFPPYVNVSEVVTFSTPHEGVDYAGPLSPLFCGNCVQYQEMDDTYANFMSDMYADRVVAPAPHTPGGSGWGTTSWMLMASTIDKTVGWISALYFPQANKTDFSIYGHGDYLTDTSDAQDLTVEHCDSCDAIPNIPGGNLSTSRHALALMYQGLLTPAQVILSPTPTPTHVPTATSSIGVCGGTHSPCNWTGWESSAWGAYSFVRGGFTIPQLPVTNYAGMTMWVGFNGDPNEVGSAAGWWARAGVEYSVDDVGDTSYTPFWDVYDTTGAQRASSTYNGFVVNPGDHISFNVWYDGASLHFDMYDSTRGAGASNQTYGVSGWKEYSAEWMVSHDSRLLTNWSSSGIAFSNCQGSPDNANWYPITYTSHYGVTMYRNSSGGVLADPGTLNGSGDGFAPVWHISQ